MTASIFAITFLAFIGAVMICYELIGVACALAAFVGAASDDPPELDGPDYWRHHTAGMAADPAPEIEP